MKKLSNTEAELKKALLIKKMCILNKALTLASEPLNNRVLANHSQSGKQDLCFLLIIKFMCKFRKAK